MSVANQSELAEFQCQWCKDTYVDFAYTSRRTYCSYACEEQEKVVFSLARRRHYPRILGDPGYPTFDDDFE